MFIPFLSYRLTFKTLACLTLMAFTLLIMTSCLSFQVNQSTVESKEEPPSISMKLFLKAPGEGQEEMVFSGVGTTLFFQQEKGTSVPVASSRQGSWVLKNAPSGKYTIEVERTAEIEGKTETFEGSLTKTFTLRPGERAEIRIVLKKVPVGLIVLGSVLIVGLVILIIVTSKDRAPGFGHLRPPPVPRLVGLPPPRALVVPLLIFSSHGRSFPGPQPIFIDGGFYYHGSSSIGAAPYDERPPLALQERPGTSLPDSLSGRFLIYPRQGQSETQQADDRYQCHLWAVGQTGWDPTQPADLSEARIKEKNAHYRRAMAACLDARGYTMK